MKERFYYLRDEENIPVVTICILAKKNAISRGVAICATSDQSSKKEGRRLAKNRALKAMGQKKTSSHICFPRATPLTPRVKQADYLMYATSGLTHKSIYNPVLTGFEQHLLGIQ